MGSFIASRINICVWKLQAQKNLACNFKLKISYICYNNFILSEYLQQIVGANASAEGGGEDEFDAAEGSYSGVNLVLAHRLTSTTFDKKGWTIYIKDYMKVIGFFNFNLRKISSHFYEK